MHRFKGHIAVILLGVFMYPIVFHVMHLASHSSADISIRQVVDLTSKLTTVDTDHSEDCAVCDYHFFVNDVPQPELNIAEVEDLVYHYFGFCAPQFNIQVLALNSPRAPPAVFI